MKTAARLYTAVAVLSLSLLATGMYANVQSRRAERAEAALRAATTAAAAGFTAPQRPTGKYPAALIRKDGSRVALDGEALEVDLGGERRIQILLQRQEKDLLFMWSPFKRDDSHVNLVVLHPFAANAYGLGLDRVSLRDAPAASLLTAPPPARTGE